MKKILLVDDDLELRNVISLILTQEGFRVETAEQCEEIKNKISRFSPGLILMDVLLSNEDGRVICQELKESEIYNSIPIVMMSAYPSAALTVSHCGADGFISKPFQLEELINLVHKHIRL